MDQTVFPSRTEESRSMSDLSVLDVLAQAILAEGVTAHYTLMGDANMHLATLMAQKHKLPTIHALHEHAAVAMADGHHRATGEVGFASVTCGPGFTQIITALTMAARGNIPLVVMVGDTPTNAAYHVQFLDPLPMTVATGAHYVPVRSLDRLLDNVREAFYVARVERRPVVLAIPMDLQKQRFPHLFFYSPSTELVPAPQRPMPDPQIVERVVDMIAAAQRPIVLGGRGAARSGSGPALEALAEQCGALLATSLLGKGLFDHNPYSLGTAGAFAGDVARELYAEADLVIGVGAGLGHYTTEAGYLYPNARVVQIDTRPRGLYQGLRVADLHVCADAKAAAEAILARLKARGLSSNGIRTPELARRLQAENERPDTKEYPPAPNVVDPRAAMLEIDRVIPKDWDVAVGSAHFFSIALTHLRGRAPERYHVINDFGAIGSGPCAAIGLAAGRNDGKVLLIDGDGSLLMQIQEMDTIHRHGIRLLMVTLNDGAYASEAHKFRAQGLDPGEAIHGTRTLSAVADGFGLRGKTVTTLGQFDRLFAEHQASNTATLWDVHIDDRIPSKLFRRVHFGEV
jgi:thiamine pyrophosphate-dependent acetolactate synthase large subunit-like protein